MVGLSLIGCMHEPRKREIVLGPTPGQSHRPYGGVPDFLASPAVEAPPPRGPDERFPVAGSAWTPPPGALDTLRVDLAGIDDAAVALRRTDPRDPRAVEVLTSLQRYAAEVRSVVSVRPDIAAEADEIIAAATSLEEATGPMRTRLLNRVEELTDLIRLEVRVTG